MTIHRHAQRGFSLVEILVAMMLFMILLLGLIPVFVQALSLTSGSASVTSSSRVASSQVEAARTLQLPIGDTARCVRFQDALATELAKTPADAGSIAAKMSGLRKVGVPYTDEEIAGAAKVLEGKTEMDALIAYLQGLGRELKVTR